MKRRQRRNLVQRRQHSSSRASIQTKLQIAASHRQAGQIAKAEKINESNLSAEPNHEGLLHLLGVIKLQNGDADTAADLIDKAIAIKPHLVEAHNNLGNVSKEIGRVHGTVA